ncbi:hypothetical protein WA026_002645 [Henosepilachna vigintioctopunctata]|uniref:Uncharacterized protein n=1 Tax=Henosepilachna vigintioctopunctata TaxID=420089 RepID=A0AAW1U0T0_9CUCU
MDSAKRVDFVFRKPRERSDKSLFSLRNIVSTNFTTFSMLSYRLDTIEVGSKFLCSEVIAPIRSEVDDISLIIVNFEDLTAHPVGSLENSPVGKSRFSKFDRARASFRQSLRLGSNLRGRGLRSAGYLTPPSDVTTAEEEADILEQCPLTSHSPTPILEQTWVPKTEVPSAVGHSTVTPMSGGCTQTKEYTALTVSHSAPASHQASFERGESVERNKHHLTNNNRNPPQNRVSHATSLDAIARRQCYRSGYPSVSISNKPQLTKQFPNVSSESDLQKYKTAQQSHDRKSPSLSNPNTDSSRQKFSLQDNGSAKYFQSGIHTPKMGEKVAQVSSFYSQYFGIIFSTILSP